MPAVIKIEINSAGTGDGLAQTTKGLRDLDSTARSAGGGFSAFREVAIGALREVGAMALQAGMQAAQALGKFASDSVSAAATFEASINGLAAVTGDSLAEAGFDMDDVSAKALQLGKDTKYSAQQAIAAMTELAKGGVPIQSVMTDATDATLALAAAGGLELAPAAEIVAKTLGVWAREGVTAANAADLLSAAANASTVDVQSLANGSANAAGRAQAMGVAYEDFITTMALIAPGFNSAETAGTSYNNFLSSLIPKTDKAKGMMQELNLITKDGKNAFFDSTGAFIGNRAAAELLTEAFAGMSSEQKSTYLNTIFGNDAMGTANMLINEGVEGYDRMVESMAATGGATEVATAKQQGFAFAMEQLSGSVETLQIVLGTKLLPLLTPLIAQFTGVVNAVMSITTAFLESGGSSMAFLTSLSALDTALGLIPGTVLQVYGSFMSFIATAQQIASQAAPFLITALGAAMLAFSQLSDFVIGIMPTVQSIVTSTLAIMQALWQQHGATIMQLTQAAFTIIQGIIQTIMGVIQGVLAIALGAITGDWDTAFTTLAASNTTIWNGISTFLSGVLNAIAAFFGTSLDELITTWQSSMEKLPVIANYAMEEAWAAFDRALGLAPGVGRAIIDGIVSGISDGVGALTSAVADAALTALNTAKDVLGISSPSSVFAAQVGYPMAQGIAAGLKSGAGQLSDAAAKTAIQYMRDAIEDAGANSIEFREAGNSLFEKLGLGKLLSKDNKLASDSVISKSLQYMLNGINEAGLNSIEFNEGFGSFKSAVGISGGGADKPSVSRNSRTTGGTTIINNYYYSPTYSNTPNKPSADFALMQSLAKAGT